ncbi:SDR family oxidoreductase [Blautia wexlerae]|nr:SDR family oxidoreductase [Blautia wexlerae]
MEHRSCNKSHSTICSLQENNPYYGKTRGWNHRQCSFHGVATAAGRGGLAYTSAKHGLLGLTRQMSLDHGRTGVRINAVLPGPIATDMIARVLAIPQHPVTMKIGMSPAKRPGEPIEVAQAIAFLASDEASFIHGAALAVDGGYTIF